MTEATPALPWPPAPFAGSDWFDPLEEAVRSQVRWFIEQLLEEELEVALGRGRYERGARANGRRHEHRPRQLVTTFGPRSLSVPRARLHETGEQEWKSALLPAHKRLSRRAEALIAEAYLAGMNTRRVRRALAQLFQGRVGKDVVSRAWQRTRSAWEAWHKRALAGDDIVRQALFASPHHIGSTDGLARRAGRAERPSTSLAMRAAWPIKKIPSRARLSGAESGASAATGRRSAHRRVRPARRSPSPGS
jgi:hypothetical protein